MSKDVKNVPALRFKGFSDAWEKRKLGEVADIRGGGTPSTSKPEYWDGEIDWYAPAEIGTQRYVSGSRRQITKLGLNKSSATMLPANKTILFTSRAGIGNAAILTNSGATNQGFQSIVVKPATDVYFLYSEIPEIKRKAIRLAAGSTFIEISGKSLTKIQIRLPSFKEQSRIGHLFLQIDNLIDATQHKIEKLELAKEATLQHMFNKSWKISGNFPSWKDADLGSLNLDISDGDWIESEHIHRTGSYRIIQTGNIGLGIFVDKSETAKYIHQSDYDELHANEVFPGDILICRLAEPAGRAIILPDIHHRMVTVVDVAVIRPSSQINAYFLVSELNRPKVLHEVGTLTSGSTRKRISRKNLEKVNLEMPSIDEQNKIAIIVESFSNIISLTQSNLTNLKTVKAFLMQSLFA